MAQLTTFAWGNYFRPTPSNLQYLSAGLKSLTVVASGSVFATGNERIAFYILMAGAFLDEASKFFARVDHDAHEVVRVEIPAELADQVTVSHETVEGDKGKG